MERNEKTLTDGQSELSTLESSHSGIELERYASFPKPIEDHLVLKFDWGIDSPDVMNYQHVPKPPKNNPNGSPKKKKRHFIGSNSIEFKLPGGKMCEWRMVMDPNYLEDGKRYISMMAYMTKLDWSLEYLDAIYELQLLSGNGTVITKKVSSLRRFTQKENCHGWLKFLPFGYLEAHPPHKMDFRAMIKVTNDLQDTADSIEAVEETESCSKTESTYQEDSSNRDPIKEQNESNERVLILEEGPMEKLVDHNYDTVEPVDNPDNLVEDKISNQILDYPKNDSNQDSDNRHEAMSGRTLEQVEEVNYEASSGSGIMDDLEIKLIDKEIPPSVVEDVIGQNRDYEPLGLVNAHQLTTGCNSEVVETLKEEVYADAVEALKDEDNTKAVEALTEDINTEFVEALKKANPEAVETLNEVNTGAVEALNEVHASAVEVLKEKVNTEAVEALKEEINNDVIETFKEEVNVYAIEHLEEAFNAKAGEALQLDGLTDTANDVPKDEGHSEIMSLAVEEPQQVVHDAVMEPLDDLTDEEFDSGVETPAEDFLTEEDEIEPQILSPVYPLLNKDNLEVSHSSTKNPPKEDDTKVNIASAEIPIKQETDHEATAQAIRDIVSDLWSTKKDANTQVFCASGSFQVHSYILKARSPAFLSHFQTQGETEAFDATDILYTAYALFKAHHNAESEDDTTMTIPEAEDIDVEVDSVELEILEGLLEYCYTGNTVLFSDFEKTSFLLLLAEELEVETLSKRCIEEVIKMTNFGKIKKTYLIVQYIRTFGNTGKNRADFKLYTKKDFVKELMELKKMHPDMLNDLSQNAHNYAKFLYQ